MLKLLTEESKNELRKEYRIRRYTVIAFSVAFVFLVAFVGLLPSYVLIASRLEETQKATAALSSIDTAKDIEELANLATDTQAKLSLLKAPRPATPHAYFKDALALKPDGIRIYSFEWKRAKAKDTIVVSGISRDRQTLLAFQKALNTSGRFSGAELPVSQFAKDKDIDFTLTLTAERR